MATKFEQSLAGDGAAGIQGPVRESIRKPILYETQISHRIVQEGPSLSVERIHSVEMATTTVPKRRKLKLKGPGGGGGPEGPDENDTRTMLHGMKYALQGIMGFLTLFALSSAAYLAGFFLLPGALFYAALGLLAGRMLLAGLIQRLALPKQFFLALGGTSIALVGWGLVQTIIDGFIPFGGIILSYATLFGMSALGGGFLGLFDHRYRG